MINYETYQRIGFLHRERGLNFAQIGRELGIDAESAAKYARAETFKARRASRQASSKLDPFKATIRGWLEHHPYSVTQIFQRLRSEEGYSGGQSILKEYVRLVRPVRHKAYLTLAFGPGECAQVDWGCAGSMVLGNTTRRLSFFVMVLAHSRMLYVEFTLGEAMEHFLSCHHNALSYFGGVPATLLIDNLKTGVLSHPIGQPATYNPRYVDFAGHYGFEARACNVRKANEKGRVENAVGYIKKNFLAGLQLPHGLEALNTAARHWMESVANVRTHGETHQTPVKLFALEKPRLRPLPPMPAELGVLRSVRATSRCRVVLDTNRYSIPSIYASQQLTLKVRPECLCVYHNNKLVATHPRSYERHRDFENSEHVRELLDQRRKAREAHLLLSFYSLCPRAEEYYQRLQERRLNASTHLNKIMALVDIYGRDQVVRVIEDAFAFEAYSSEYLANLLEQRRRHTAPPGPLHLTRQSDLLELDLGPADLSLYQPNTNTPNINTPS